MHLLRPSDLGEFLHVRQTPDGGNGGDMNANNNTTNTQDQDNGQKSKGGSNPSYTAAVAVAIVAVVFTAGIFIWLVYRRWQRTRTPKYTRSGRDDNDHTEAGPATTETRPAAAASAAAQGTTASVDRNTSVRSVMTLPPYRPRALEGESVLGREGERDGIDVVIELPTAEADETLREEEMDTLYQIRLARRRQQQEREERRDARREARARGDQAALETIRQQSRSATTNNPHELERLRAEHARAQEQRQHAVSSVNYADLGVARHDGTRIRANSSESERIGLLSDAASIGASGRSPSALSQNSTTRPDAHQRGRSASSVVSINTILSDDQAHGEQLQGPAQDSLSRASSEGRAGSSPELIDSAEADMNAPPGYDEVSLNDLTPQQSRTESPYSEPPPDYSAAAGPTETRNRRLSERFTDLAAEVSSADASAPTAASASAVAGGGASRSSSNASQGSRRTSRQGGIPQLPSLRLTQLPQIVIEPSSAVPRADDP